MALGTEMMYRMGLKVCGDRSKNERGAVWLKTREKFSEGEEWREK